MNILFLAPHPYYIDRGTPIAVDCMLRVLLKRGELVDVLTYHEGRTNTRENISIHRIKDLGFVKNTRPGLSWKKIVCDVMMIVALIPSLFKKRYPIIHAVKESAFMALAIKLILGTPYVYDMDSSLSQQIIAKFSFLTPVVRLLEFAEKIVVKYSVAVTPACPVALKDMVKTISASYHVNLKFVRIPAWPVFLLGDVCELIFRPLGIEPPFYRRRVAFFTKDRAFNAQKMMTAVGFEPKYDNLNGLKETAQWYLDRKWLRISSSS